MILSCDVMHIYYGLLAGFQLDTEENDNLVPGFLGSLIGIRPGETRSFPIQFPESFDQESLQGVRAQFTVSITPNCISINLSTPLLLPICMWEIRYTCMLPIKL